MTKTGEYDDLSRSELLEVIQELENQVRGTCGLSDRVEAKRVLLEQGRRKSIGLVLAAYGEAINRGDKLTAEVLDALASQIEHCQE